MGIIRNFLNSEKAIASGLLVVGASIMAITGQMSVAEWQSYTLACLGIYTGGKTIQGAAAKIAEARKAPDESARLKSALAANDAKADAAVEEKFGGDK